MKRMTRRTRVIVLMSLFTTILLMATVVAYLVAAAPDEDINPGEIWVAVIVVAAGVASVILTWWLRSRRAGDSARLQEDYFAAYEEVADWLQGSPMSLMERKEVQRDVLALLLEAQEQGRPVSDVVGQDAADFARQVQESFGYRSRAVHLLLSGVLYAVAYAFMIQLVGYYRDGAASFYEARADISLLLLMGLAAFVVAPMLQLMVRRGEVGWQLVLPLGVMVVAIGLLEGLRALFYETGWVQTLLDGELRLMPGPWAVGLWLAAAGLALAAQAAQREISLRRL